MAKYALVKHDEHLKRASFKELKRPFLESVRSRNMALLTKCVQGWRNLHL